MRDLKRQLDENFTLLLKLAADARVNIAALHYEEIDARDAYLPYQSVTIDTILADNLISVNWTNLSQAILELKQNVTSSCLHEDKSHLALAGSHDFLNESTRLAEIHKHPSSHEAGRYDQLMHDVKLYRQNILSLVGAIEQVGQNFIPGILQNDFPDRNQLIRDLNKTLYIATDRLQKHWSDLTKRSQILCWQDTSNINIKTNIGDQRLDFFMSSTLGYEYQRLQHGRSCLYSLFKSSSREKQMFFLQSIAQFYHEDNDVLRGALLLVQSQIELNSPFGGRTTMFGNHGSDLKRLVDARLHSDNKTMTQGNEFYLKKLKEKAGRKLIEYGFTNDYLDALNRLIESVQSYQPMAPNV